MWNVLAAIASIITAVQLLPQAWKAIQAKELSSISLPTFLIISFTTFLWTLYGLHLEDIAIIVANASTCLCAVTVSLMKWRKG
jgi:uncharacterized protein with PQ loop repeat